MGAYKKLGMVTEKDGGERLTVPITYATNPTVAFINPWDEITPRESNELTMAEYDWKQVKADVALSYMDIVQNKGESKVIDLVDAKLSIMEDTLRQSMNGALYTDNSGDPTKYKGLIELVAATGNVGGIASGQTWWRSIVDSTAEALDEADMESVWNQAQQNLMAPDLIVTTRTLYEKYMDLARATINTNKPDARMAELGFEGATFKGKPIIWDNDCPAGYMWFLNSKYLKLCPVSGFNFKASGKEEMQKQFVFFWKLVWIGCHAITNRRMFARLQGKTA